MATRRFWLVLGGVGLLASAAAPAAAGTGEVEGGVHGGSASGHWACGPAAQVKYGGLGARGRVWLNEREKAEGPAGSKAPKTGFSVGGGLAGEHRTYRFLGCNSDETPCPLDRQVVPPGGLVGAASLSLGYDWEVFGLRAGALLWQNYNDHNTTRPDLRVAPEVSLRLGKFGRLRGEAGIGSYSTDTMLRPGAYLGLTMPLSPAVELTGRLGGHQNFDGNAGARADVSVQARVSDAVSLSGGVGLSQGEGNRVEPSGRLGMAFGF